MDYQQLEKEFDLILEKPLWMRPIMLSELAKKLKYLNLRLKQLLIIFGAKGLGKIGKIRDNPLFTGNPLELPVNPQNQPIEARTGALSSDSPKNQDNPLYRSVLGFKIRYKNLDFKPPFLTILGDIS